MFTVILLALAALQSDAGGSAKADSAFAEGERLLQGAQAQDLFMNESASGDGAIMLRHKASGFQCVMNPGKAVNAVTVFPSPVRGDDVGCTSETITDVRTLYLTRTAGTLAQQVDSVSASIRTRYPGARQARLSNAPSMFMTSGMDIPPHITVGFDTRESYEQATIGMSGGWVVKYRFSTAPGRSGISGVLESFWFSTVLEPRLAAIRAARAAAAPPPVEAGTPQPQ